MAAHSAEQNQTRDLIGPQMCFAWIHVNITIMFVMPSDLIMFVVRALHSIAARFGDRKPNKSHLQPSLRGLQMTLGGLPVTKEGCKGVQRPKEQTLLLLLSIEDVK